MNHLQTDCRKRKRAEGAGEPGQGNVVGMQEVPLPGWIDLNSSHDAPLPPGWEQCLDLQSGKMYFVNAATQTRVLEDPRRGGMLFNGQSMMGKGESLGLDLEMRLPSLATMHHPKAGMPGSPSMFFKDIPNHCNGFHNYDISATNPSLLMAPFSTNSTAAATNSTPNMAATVCIHCHTFVMVSRQTPHCPSCKNVCNMDLSISSGQ